MGSLIIPAAGLVYADAQTIIYTVEKHPIYFPVLLPLWYAVQSTTIEVVSSELSLLETLVGPMKNGDTVLEAAYEQFFQQAGMRLLPITDGILRSAARLRATTRLRTPDALHAATATSAGCVSFVTNDKGFRAVPGIAPQILDDVLIP